MEPGNYSKGKKLLKALKKLSKCNGNRKVADLQEKPKTEQKQKYKITNTYQHNTCIEQMNNTEQEEIITECNIMQITSSQVPN